ncbi:MAG: DUF4428 domain-containing protein [Lachnospiraceae bacterium]|jgi:hypothetical protein|nr:DUF4428 domain-containing protein [Lachnospiraceae bacterium]
MGLFGKVFEKKECSICGGEIGLLGNRKLEDGNMCKSCAAKLSPFFSDRRSSTVAEIKEQLDYREANKDAVKAFHTTRTLGENTKLMIDEDAKKFMVTRARNLEEANPDVISFSDVTGVEFKIDEDKSEEKKEDKDGNKVSYNPPKYIFEYDFHITIRVNNPYFDTISFQLNPSSVQINEDNPLPINQKPNERQNREFIQYEKMGNEIKNILTVARQDARHDREAAAAPKTPVVCPLCGATTIPTPAGTCEYCGGPVK